ncbi:MAG: FAD:protein FMN transferase, partial [Lachnospiraceae bacterium]|nr:FAD:protein FMN transferase [Lachnospiraceae bacterium]
VKGPMVTPREGDPWPNLVSANSLLRRGLDLFAAVRPIRMPDKGIDWTFFRENIEGEYILGNRGIQVNDDLAIDFKVATRQGCERIGRAALDFCRKNGKKSLTIITKANIVKLVDGNFIKYITEVAEREYPEVTVGTRFVDAMSAKMMDPGFNEGMEVFVLPNLYGDIVTDVAAEHQGGLGTASSSNIGNRYALFEAIHGTAPRLIARGCGDYADPCSLIRAMGMMMAHIGYADRKQLLEKALALCEETEGALDVTLYPLVREWGFTTGAYQIPHPERIRQLLSLVDYRRVSLSQREIRIEEGMALDFGSIAKGYATDLITARLREAGVTSALLNFGGNVQLIGSKGNGDLWQIGIQNPLKPDNLGVLRVADKAVVTSGGYQRHFIGEDGQDYWHILDPESGSPARSGLLSVTVVGREGWRCDGLSTALFVMGPEKARQYWLQYRDFDLILVGEEGQVILTEGLKDSFRLNPGASASLEVWTLP